MRIVSLLEPAIVVVVSIAATVIIVCTEKPATKAVTPAVTCPLKDSTIHERLAPSVKRIIV